MAKATSHLLKNIALNFYLYCYVKTEITSDFLIIKTIVWCVTEFAENKENPSPLLGLHFEAQTW